MSLNGTKLDQKLQLQLGGVYTLIVQGNDTNKYVSKHKNVLSFCA
jgi:hypothetical protein